ncbi:cell division protein ZapD [Orbus sturtevantii]|uniref:cell division protein ZapD n=1 Tax=Orbus sturtevantii TaxID=3074109 RepID=UPI00370D59B6
MDNAKVIFEHPLNEKMRTWLRIEFLIKQIECNKKFDSNNALLFFHSLCELLEIVERNDIRSDLSKDIDEQKQKLSIWLNKQGVDIKILTTLLDKLNDILAQLNATPKLGQSLKSDRFISSLRKRLTIPGGCCCFDLPLFHLWLQQSQEYRDLQIAKWLESFSTLYLAISFYIQLVRQSGGFKLLTCSNNFYQNPNEVSRLLRIRLPINKGLYPQVSGNANCYAIRFVRLESELDNKIEMQCVEFELANC